MISRRRFFECCGAIAGTTLASAGLGRALGRAYSMWAAPSSLPAPRTLVLINCEGGFDALSMLPPIGSNTPGSLVNAYLTLRPTLGWQTGGAIPPLSLSGVGGTGLHPALTTFQGLWAAGRLAVVRKVGMPVPEFSHFRARDVISKGRASAAHADPRGWLGRLADGGLSGLLDILGVGVENRLDFNASGAAPVVFRTLDNFNAGSFLGTSESNFRRDILSQMLQQTPSSDNRIVAESRLPGQRAFDLSTTLINATAPITLSGTYPSIPSDGLTNALRDIAKIIGSTLGTKVFYTATGGYDTHASQETIGSASKPTLTERLTELMQALGGFITDLQSPAINKWNSTAVVLYTEFGRRNYENNNAGTDHGHGFHAFVFGGGVVGGLKGNAVTAADVNSSSGNLPVNIDYRTLFRKCLAEWLLLPTATVNSVFDDFTPSPTEPTFTLF